MLKSLQQELKQIGNSEKAVFLQRFFKTGPGDYAEGDIFIGVSVPDQRKLATKYHNLSLKDLTELLQSPIHEERLTALFIMVNQYKKGDDKFKRQLHETYAANTEFINNWDLVDSSAENLVGDYTDRTGHISLLPKLAKSKHLWERRIAMIATYHFIKQGRSTEALKVAEILINDQHDLIQKAVGWMLREVGKRCSKDELVKFLGVHYKTMPRTALRYAIEHFPNPERQAYLTGTI